jgi:putative ABC transport system ATP-binding protein
MAVQLANLVKRYVGPDGSVVPVVDVDRFDLADGEQAALVGTSGSGKTTLLHLIAGILTPDSGNVLFGETTAAPGASITGERDPGGNVVGYRSAHPTRVNAAVTDITTLSEAQRDVFRGANVGYIFQTHHLLGGFTAMENVLLGMSFTGRAPDRAWAVHLLERVGLADRLHYKPAKLSVGQQQRVAVARALANRPKVVLADEPTGALDEANAQQVLSLIRDLCKEVNASLLLVTHDMGIAKQFPRTVTLAEINRRSG